MLRQLLRPVVRKVSQRGTRAYHDAVANYKPATMDDLPIPQGSWQQNYDAKQKIFNIQFVAGLTCLIGTITYIATSGVIFFNYFPPVPPKNDEQK